MINPAPTPAQPEAQLLRIALLGTRQSGESVPTLPGLETVPPDDPDAREKLLLLTAGALALMQKAGFQPLAGLPAPAPGAPPESRVPLGRQGTRALRELLEHDLFGLSNDYLKSLVQHQRLIPPELLVPVLHSDRLRPLITAETAAVLGERGHWLARQNPDWQHLVTFTSTPAGPATWEIGSLPERRAYLRQLRRSDPEQARQLLLATLPREPAATQAALLGELGSTLAAADEPLLTQYLTSKSKEVRQTVLPLLARLPQSALVERLWQRALPLLRVEQPARGGPQLLVTLPEAWDKAWLADGIEQRDSSFEGGERAGWLGQLLALLPPSRWAAHLRLAPEELLTLAEKNEWARLLLRAWGRATALHRDRPFAAPLLLRHLQQPGLLPASTPAQLSEVLDAEEKLALVRSQLPYQAGALPTFLPELLHLSPTPWPADVTAAALRYSAEVLAPAIVSHYGEPAHRLNALLLGLLRAVPETEAARCTEALYQLAERYPVLAQLAEHVSYGFRFRQQLAASLTEPADG